MTTLTNVEAIKAYFEAADKHTPHAQRAIDRIPAHPAGTAITTWRKHLEETRQP